MTEASVSTPVVDFATRQRRLGERLREAGLDALALNPGPSLQYLTGLPFHLMERPVVGLFRAGTAPVLVLPELETGKLEGLSYAVEAFPYGENPATWPDVYRQAAAKAGIDGARVGVESTRLRVLELRMLEKAAPQAQFVDGDASIGALRLYKDASEVALMREAVVVAQDAVRATLAFIRPGVTEREVAAELTLQMLRAGCESELPFAPIIAFGAETANPHAAPGDRRLREDDLVLIDWGANVHGYFSDLTRMYAVGQVDPELARITAIVEAANAAGRAAAGPGVPAGDVDRAARRVIEEAGYGPRFIHRTGHGLGLEAHEGPYIRGDNTLVLEEGMTFTIEPGIYVPGLGGARIEDDMVITAGGAESLSDLERSLVTIA